MQRSDKQAASMMAQSLSAVQSVAASPRLWLKQALLKLISMQRCYAAKMRLADLDDAALKDVGLTRHDMRAELSKPFWRF